MGPRPAALSVLPRLGSPRPAARRPGDEDRRPCKHALLVRQWSDDVIFFAHTQELAPGDRMRSDARGVTVVVEWGRAVGGRWRSLDGRRADGGDVVPRAAVFIRPTNVPHPDGLATGLGCDLDDAGFPVVDASGRTSVAGVWAVGNAVDPRLQIITAAGGGSAAAIAINADLVDDDVALALAVPGQG